jgi:hypothetical protein
LAWRSSVLQQLSAKAAILSVQRTFPVAGLFNIDVIRDAQTAYLSQEIDRLGGFDAIFKPLPDNFVQAANTQLMTLLEKVYRQGMGVEDKSFSFTDTQIKTIQSNVNIFLKKYADEYRKAEIKVLAGTDLKDMKFLKNALSDKLATYLATREEQIVMSKSGSTIEEDIDLPDPANQPGETKTIKKHLSLPVFTSEVEDRVEAAGFLKADRSEDLDWALVERAKIKDDLKATIEAAFGTDPAKLEMSKLPKDVARWILENMKVAVSL